MKKRGEANTSMPVQYSYMATYIQPDFPPNTVQDLDSAYGLGIVGMHAASIMPTALKYILLTYW
jgi:hypothetical protein